MPLDSFVDDLFRGRGVRSAPEDTAALVCEVKELFEKLATDIPAQLARGMETALREIVPRVASGRPPALSPTEPPPAATGPPFRTTSPRWRRSMPRVAIPQLSWLSPTPPW